MHETTGSSEDGKGGNQSVVAFETFSHETQIDAAVVRPMVQGSTCCEENRSLRSSEEVYGING